MKRLGVILLLLVGVGAFALVNMRRPPREVLQVAAASNFAPFLRAYTQDVQQKCAFQLKISAGASGTLATQIINGAPFALFFSADAARPQVLLHQGIGKSAHTYAIGQLVYWQPSLLHPKSDDERPLALADPRLAPYGQAALQSLAQLKMTYDLPVKRVWGRSAAQVFQFVHTGAAKAGLVPLSLVRMADVAEGEYKLVPQNLYDPIRQDVLVLRPSAAVDCLFEVLNRPKTRAVMLKAGFTAP